MRENENFETISALVFLDDIAENANPDCLINIRHYKFSV